MIFNFLNKISETFNNNGAGLWIVNHLTYYNCIVLCWWLAMIMIIILICLRILKRLGYSTEEFVGDEGDSIVLEFKVHHQAQGHTKQPSQRSLKMEMY